MNYQTFDTVLDLGELGFIPAQVQYKISGKDDFIHFVVVVYLPMEVDVTMYINESDREDIERDILDSSARPRYIWSDPYGFVGEFYGSCAVESRTAWPRVLSALDIAIQDLSSIASGAGVTDVKTKNLARAILDEIESILKIEEKK